MSNVWAISALAVLGGLAVTLQGQFMALMEQNMGTKVSVLITYGSGGLAAVLLFFLLPGSSFKLCRELPWYVFSAGLLGLVIVGSIGFVLPRMGAAKGFTLMIAAQFILAAAIDHYGLFGAALRPLDLQRIGGMAIVLAGVWMVIR